MNEQDHGTTRAGRPDGTTTTGSPAATPYVRAMDTLNLSADEKEDLMSELATQYFAHPPMRAAATGGSMPLPARTPLSRRTFVGVAVAATLAAGAAGLAIASGLIKVDVGDLVGDFFNRSQVPLGPDGSEGSVYFPRDDDSTPAGSAAADAPGTPLGVSASVNGVTITADSVVGDRHSAIIVFTLAKDDGSPLNELGVDSLSGSPEAIFQGQSLSLDVESTSKSMSFGSYDADPTDNAVQLYCVISTDATLPGATATARFVDLAAMDERDPDVDGPGNSWIRRTVVPGTWELTFPLDYEDRTRTLTDVGQPLTVEYATAVIDRLEVSPIAVRANLALTADVERLEQDGGSPSDVVDQLLGLSMALVMRDGETVDIMQAYPSSRTSPGLGSVGGGGAVDAEGAGEVDIMRYTPWVIDVDKVVAVRIGDVEMPLGEA